MSTPDTPHVEVNTIRQILTEVADDMTESHLLLSWDLLSTVIGPTALALYPACEQLILQQMLPEDFDSLYRAQLEDQGPTASKQVTQG